MKKPLLAAVAAVVVLGGIALTVPSNPPTQLSAPMPHKFVAAPSGAEPVGSPMPPQPPLMPDMNCGPDMTTKVQKFLTTLPPGTTSVTFPHDACYTVDKGIVLENIHDLTINGNGATFNQWPPPCDFLQTGITLTPSVVTSTTMTLSSVAGLSVGATVTGAGIHGSTTISDITGKVVTLTAVTPGPLTLSPYTFSCPDVGIPVLFLAADSNININGLNIQGSWDGDPNTNHGVDYEGKSGMVLNGNTNVTITNSTIQGTLGDGFALGAAGAPGGGFLPGLPLNHDITLSNSTLNNIGYTFFIGGADGVTVSGITLNNYQQTDFEIDSAGTGFNCQSCPPVYAAQDNILFTNSVFSNFHEFWFTSLQGNPIPTSGTTHTAIGTSANTLTLTSVGGVAAGQAVTGAGIATFATVKSVNTTTKVVTLTAPASPGPLTNTAYTFAMKTCLNGVQACLPPGCVGTQCTSYFATQQVNVTWSGNTIKCSASCQLVQTSGTPAGFLQSRYFNIGLTITGNTLLGVGKSTTGGSVCVHNSGSMLTFKNVNRVSVTNNLFPANIAAPGICSPPSNGPFAYLAAVGANRVNGLTIEHNRFAGAFSILNTSSANNTNEVNCGNTYGLNGSFNDGSC